MLTFEQALGLLALSWILFGGFRGRAAVHHWRGRIMDRWEKMAPEEREKVRAGLRGRGGAFDESAAEHKN
jgi:hypothetical protein